MKLNLSRRNIFFMIGAILILSSSATWALPPRVSWSPERLAPSSVAPGEGATYTLTLVHTGILPVPDTHQLQIVATGDIAPFVTIDRPMFPPVLRRGQKVAVTVHVAVPSDMSLSMKRGEILLQRVLPNGKVKEIFRAEALPVELTFSSLLLPPDPGEAGKTDLLGIDSDGDGVRDDINRYIVFTYPDSEKKREALKQSARSLNAYLRDSDDKAKTRENGASDDKALDCIIHVFNSNLDTAFKVDDELRAQFLDTKERSRAYARADQQMGGYVSNNGPASERFERRRAACSFDADSLPN